ncbi:MAG: SDR family oxidoreductase [Pseudomonadota bacterium]
MTLAGKRALVTGASKGIGLGIVEALHAEGVHVVAVARGLSDLEAIGQRLDEGFEGWAMDAGSDGFLERLDRNPPFDLLVNNLGMARHALLSDTSDEDLDLVLNVNLRATLRITRHVVSRMQAGASVTTITSQMAHIGSPKRVVYCATKHALEGMTKALAVELAPQNVRVNSVAPTFVRTPLTAPMLADKDFAQWVESMIPLGRVAEVEDIAEAVLYLAQAKSVTGHSLRVDGGWTAR